MSAPSDPADPALKRPLALVLFVAVALRLALLLMFGPRLSYDATTGYMPYADLILGGGDWLHDAGLGASAVPITAFRMIGYPALVALAKLIAGSGWTWAIIIAQIVASLITVTLVMRLATALAPDKPVVAVLAGLATATGQPLNTDTAIQTDSFAAALLVAFAVLAARGALQRSRLGPWQAIGLGLLPAACFLLRESTDFTVLALLPFAGAWIWRTASVTGKKAGLAVAILAPLVTVNAGQLAWNSHRTGEAFVTTGPQIILLQALMHAQWTGDGVLDQDGPIDAAVRQQLAAGEHPNGFLTQGELWAVNQKLFDGGWNALEIARRMKARYLEAWRDHPSGMLHASQRNLPIELLFLPGSGLRNDPNTTPSPTGTADDAGETAIFTTLSNGMGVVSLAIVVGFLLASGAALYRRALEHQPLSCVSWFGLGALFAVFGLLVLHAAVHFENRFIAPVEPLVILAGICGIATMQDRAAVKRPG